ncbi:MAG TPA: alpha/beta hydrolase [Roseiflexaceae bacterium]|nr:alpha/beta hydrolase [Roseiflexaceae bacterium]
MHTTQSRDGTRIAFNQLGQGPALVMVGGALQHRALDRVIGQRAALLAQRFTVLLYDRRGRGDSGDTQPYTVEREIEDLEAAIDSAGGCAYVLGMSSGGALALEAAVALGAKIQKLAVYEVPYNDDTAARASWAHFAPELRALLAADRREDALMLFMRQVGTAEEQIAGMRDSSLWPMLVSVAHTLAYDITVLGPDCAIPAERVARVAAPTLVLDGGASFAFMPVTARALARLIPDAQHRTLAGQTHAVQAEVLAAALGEFFVEE